MGYFVPINQLISFVFKSIFFWRCELSNLTCSVIYFQTNLLTTERQSICSFQVSRPSDVSRLYYPELDLRELSVPTRLSSEWMAIASEREKGGGRGKLSCLSGIEGHSSRLLIFYERGSRVGWPAKGVVCSARRTVRRRLGRRMSMSVSKIQFGLVFWKLWFRSYVPDILGAHLGRGSCCVQVTHGWVSSCYLGLVIYAYVLVCLFILRY
jgi:hypothetical protein